MIRNIKVYPTPGDFIVVGSDPNLTEFVTPALTNFAQFPSTFAAHPLANVMINQTSDGIVFVNSGTLALQKTNATTQTVANGLVRQQKYSATLSGSIAYNNSTGDITVPVDGWYVINTIGYTSDIDIGNTWYLATTDGAGAVATYLRTITSDGINAMTPIEWMGFLEAGTTVGLFVSNGSGGDIDIGDSADDSLNFSIKYLA